MRQSLEKRVRTLEENRPFLSEPEFNKVSYPKIGLLQHDEMIHYDGILKKLQAGLDIESVSCRVHPMVWESINSLHAAIEARRDDFEKLSEEEIRERCEHVRSIFDRCMYPVHYYSEMDISLIPVNPVHPRLRSGEDRVALFFGEMDESWLEDWQYHRTEGDLPGLLTLEELTPKELARLRELESFYKTRHEIVEELPSGAKAYRGYLTRDELREKFDLIRKCHATWESRGWCVTPESGKHRCDRDCG
ncbi:MAG: hypothetical protein PHN90_09900 [Methanothrix sp.]|nr:hypothetical protein [Methanothrix sp.]MDD5769022.1 hypothetical protein [Methanothrix sp.]